MAPATRITRAFSYYFVILVSEPSDFSSGLWKTISCLDEIPFTGLIAGCCYRDSDD
ncbi:hypothetical protein WN944_022599 [Citrus x changshan-huyou]|uniref:Uncharacterized protein n=1 Tax=Citrus x changshan-huyou TaxID=2935761 RepID=A0AAP0R3A2_9ROSI